MVEFGNELIIESYKIPWLIWIQLLVMVLLIILLFFGFTIFTSDSSTSSSSSSSGAATAPPLTTRRSAPPSHPNNPTSSNRMIKVEDQRATRDAGTSGGSIREEDQSDDESTLKDPMFSNIFQRPDHPCNYIGLAKRALFKCFGLDSSSDGSSNHQHEKQE
ncbi:hypothetical protein CDL12_13573 [Handroanthus impetiginosus]|uniref:Uncharacterized protein n=1 Tax=Handroanthus impetiginosus TaxID=429701 RepID=A0A2G9H8F8_9LAMI|nr:hypothetical protein CDL12_13573 [Handroanthus impetiginosus]